MSKLRQAAALAAAVLFTAATGVLALPWQASASASASTARRTYIYFDNYGAGGGGATIGRAG
jgi:hypothetical protein